MADLDHRSQWLDPVDALTEFLPPDDYHVGFAADDQLSSLERIRYGFRCGGIGLLIAANTDSEVIDPLPTSVLPNTPRWMRGLINLRGNLVPIFDLADFLGLSAEIDDQRRMLILEQGERAVGVLIDGLPEVPTLERRLKNPPPLPGMLSEHVSDAYFSREFVWLEFNHEEFFKTLTQQFVA